MARYTPWMLNGYTAELEKTWTKNRASVVEAIDQRRRQMVSQVQDVPAQA